MELVAVRLDLLEEPLDARKPPVARVHELAGGLGQLLPRRRRVEPSPPRRLHQLTLVPPARRVRPRLHGALGEAPRAVRHHERLVVLEDVAESLALRARPQRVIEREQEGLRPIEAVAAAAAAQVLAEFMGGAADHLDRELSAALAQRRLDRLGDAGALRPIEHDAIEDHRDGR